MDARLERRARVRSAAAAIGRAVARWSPEERDAVLYAASALFALLTVQLSGIALYRQWGEIAFGPYLLAALASAWLARRHRRAAGPAPLPLNEEPAVTGRGGRADGQGWHWTTPRMAIFLLVLVGATLLPLSLEVSWRSATGGDVNVQPEVVVVESAGHRVSLGQDPYQVVNPKRPPAVPPGQPAYEAFDPYLPLMSLLGLAHSTRAPPALTDARVAFSIVTIVVVALAMALTRGPTGPRVLALQAMTVLPTAGLPLATGGDDLPVVAFMLLGLVLLQRRRPVLAGLVLGVVSSMKFTAWPLALLAFLVVRDRDGRRTRRGRVRYGAGLAAVVVPAVLPSFLANVPAFVQNVVRFPLGLAGVQSPAATPLLGHLFLVWFPHLHRAFTVTLVVAGAAVLGWVLLRRPPRDTAAVCRLLGWATLAAILLAPATRIGYLLYPVDFFAWAWLMAGERSVEPPVAVELQPRSRIRRARPEPERLAG